MASACGGGGGPSLSLDFLSGTLDPRITFTRGTNATLTDSTGKLTYAPANLLTYSEQFDNAAWFKGNTTITANAATAPDGTTTADQIDFAAVANANIQPTVASTVTVGVTYIFSVYIRAASAVSNVKLSMQGTDTAISVGTTWQRLTMTVAASGSTLAPTIVTRDGVAVTLYIWGAQLEAVTYQTTPGTYVATTSTAYYGPRFDYDPVTLAAKGLLVEEARTNLLTYSEQFDNAAWTKSNTTVTANTTVAPDGTTTADKLVENTATSSHVVDATVAVISGTVYATSIYAKAGERTSFSFRANNDNSVATFNLANGTVGAATNATASITDLGNGWYRCALVWTATSSASVIALRVRMLDAGGNTSYTGDGTSGVYLYGAQLEAGAFATSYIPTVASTVTRSADVATMTGTNFSSWYNQTQGTFVVGADTYNVTTSKTFFSASNGTANNEHMGFVAADSSVQLQTVVGGVTQASIALSNAAANTSFKTAYAYKVNDFAASLNGGTAVTDTSGTLPTVDQLGIGVRGNSTLWINGHIRSIAYYNTRLPNAQLQALTA